MSWIKLVDGNDWGHRFYALGPCPGTWDRRRDAVVSNIGNLVKVRWPDGNVSIEQVGSATHSQEVGDHGKYYSTSNAYPVLLVEHRGVPARVPLTDVEVWSEEWPLQSQTP